MRARTTTIRRIAALVLAAAAGTVADALAAQDRILVRPEPGTPVVAVEVLVGVGPADEEADAAGIAYLTARSVVEPARAVIDSLGGRLEVEGHKDAVSFSLAIAPDAWEEAARALMVALFRDPVDSAAVARQRRALVRELEARQLSPADALAREVDRALFGPGHPWGRPTVGTPETVARISAGEVDAFLRRAFTPERSVAAVVGPVEREEARAVLEGHFGEGDLRMGEVDPPAPTDEPVRTEYDAITTWVSASWHFGGQADVEALRMLSHLALQRVSFGPSRRSVYNARADVTRYPGGGELRIDVVVPPREADAWAERLREAVSAFAGEPLPGPQFGERIRRYRGERLLELELPEARARTLARNALLGGRVDTLVDFEGLTAERLNEAARALSAPVLVFLGPSVEGGE
ncbi:MAG TPA: insulinase family protein [Longimicrobium sp.]|nr:insulinase family protein [Longimicrobium sp.]